MNKIKPNDLSWIDGTQRCAQPDIDPDWFFNEDYQHQLVAAAICHACPLIFHCRQYALHNRVDGVWGGLTERAIIAERKKRNIVPHNISGDTYLYALGVQNGVRPRAKE